MKKIIWFSAIFLLISGYITLGYGQTQESEEITVTTYYPAPYGEYDGLKAKKATVGTYALPTSKNNLTVEGKVGIGTSAPSTKLDVNSTTSGAVRIVDGTQAAGKVLTSDANGVGTWQNPPFQEMIARTTADVSKNSDGGAGAPIDTTLRFTLKPAEVYWYEIVACFQAPTHKDFIIGVRGPRTNSALNCSQGHGRLMWDSSGGRADSYRVVDGYGSAVGWSIEERFSANQKVSFVASGFVIHTSTITSDQDFGLIWWPTDPAVSGKNLTLETGSYIKYRRIE
jgi:hypothetical protein